MFSPQNQPHELTQQDKAKLSAYLNGASFSIDSSGRERFIPRIETVEDDLKVIYVAERSGPSSVKLMVSVELRSSKSTCDLTDFVFDLVDYKNDQRVTGELETRKTIRVFPGLIFDRIYQIFPHGDDGGAEVRDPARRPPPSLREAQLPERPYDIVDSGAVGANRR